ncbi:hypothetical protein KEM54_004942 [Ascosphaera aggregata]|nr:hypothetical protein KEM54_004942 [Ascosphaera aggregata]
MSKKFKSQASSSRAAAAAFSAFGSHVGGAAPSFFGLGNNTGVVSSLSFISEPPDLSTISEPNVVVALKNLLKKDSTTKARALDVLQEVVVRKAEAKSALENGFLEAWFNVYPRLSIDISRRVRQLAHSVHGSVVSTAGKRVARLMPRVIGAWLAGLYDNDRPVMRAAQDSFLQVFTTDAKRQGVWKAYQEPILDFVEDAILVQTPLTLSDERSTGPDDMELKHARVVATAAYTCNNLFARLSPSEREKNSDKLQMLVKSKRLWAFAHHDDPFVRRAIYSLLETLLPMAETYLDWKVISSSLLSKSLARNQTGSSLEYISLLLAITKTHPTAWSHDYSGKCSALSRLYQYLRNGSEGAPAAYWEAVGKLLRIMPTEMLASADGTVALSEAINLMNAIHDALTSRDEFRPNLPAAWSCYISMASYVSQQLGDDGNRHNFAKSVMFPILEHYFGGEGGESTWVLPSGSAISLSAECFTNVIHAVGKSEMIAFWEKVTDQLITAIQISEPESSKTYKSSQDAICFRSDRYFSWEAYILDEMHLDDALSFVPDMFRDASKSLLEAAITLVKSRNGKPYGAAAVIEHITITPFLKGSNSDILSPFIADELPKQMLTPSGSRLLTVLFACRDNESFQSGFKGVLDELNSANIHSLPSDVLQKLFSSISADDLHSYPVLKQLIDMHLAFHLEGRRGEWDEIAAVLENPASRDDLGVSLVTTIVDALYSDRNIDGVLKGVSGLISRSGELLQLFANGTSGSRLISRLLYFSENATDSTEEIVASMLRKVKMARGGEDRAKSAIEILHHNFVNANETSLSVDTMIEIAQEALSVSPHNSHLLSQVLPTSEQWEKALEPFLQLPPNPSEAIINTLGGLASLTSHLSSERASKTAPTSLDSHGFSAGFRLAFFVTRIMKDRRLECLDENTLRTLFTYLPLGTQIINSDLSIAGTRHILLLNDPQIQYECAEVISESRSIIKNWMHESDAIFDHWESMADDLHGRSVKSYLLAETFVNTLAGEKSWSAQKVENRLRWGQKLETQENPFALAALIAANKDVLSIHPLGVRLCNELVADLTSMCPNEDEGVFFECLPNQRPSPTNGCPAIPKLVQLRTLGSEPLQQVQHQRLVILVNRLITRLEDSIDQVTLASEITLVLYEVIPSIKEMYGSQWSSLLDILREMWHSVQKEDRYLPFVHASLRLFTRLRSMATEGESNEDLEEAWMEAQKGHSESIIKLLEDLGSFLRRDQPRTIVAELLARTASSLSVEHLKDTTNLLSTLTVDSKSIQQASRSVLQQAIPKAMEELSLGVALGEKGVELPSQVLSILSRAPSMELISQAGMDESIWSTLRSYFLAWSVIFDLFTHASIPVKKQFTAIIKEEGLIPELLNFTYDFLQQGNGKLVDASKFDIRNFALDQSSSDENEAKWFAIHLYYLSLRHLPNLTTLWWSESKNRIKGPVEVWTEKYFSPLVVEDALKGVQEWVASQDWSQEDLPMEVKVSFNVKEIVASIEIDEDSPPSSICISMPTAYPLQLPVVNGRTRIAVSEKKWQSWLRTISGAVKFQGSLVDALMIYRRNTQGALKGQTECAICYSIVSPSMKLPNKRCATW